MFGPKHPDINAPGNQRAFPYWPGLGIQVPSMIPGQIMSGEIVDIRVNRIPSETDYNPGDIRRIPAPNAPANDVTGAAELMTHKTPMGRGSGVGLMDMLQTSIAQTQARAMEGPKDGS